MSCKSPESDANASQTGWEIPQSPSLSPDFNGRDQAVSISRFSSGKHLIHAMASNNQYATEIARLHRTAAESRLRSVESQLSLSFTLCAIAETEIRYSRPDEAIKVINKLRHHAETIRLHLDEPNHLPKIAISGLRKELTKLTKRTEEIESSLRLRRLA